MVLNLHLWKHAHLRRHSKVLRRAATRRKVALLRAAILGVIAARIALYDSRLSYIKSASEGKKPGLVPGFFMDELLMDDLSHGRFEPLTVLAIDGSSHGRCTGRAS
jgi:hypothetical protein